MARIFTSGFELNSTTSGMEWSGITGGAVSATNARTGSRCYRISSLSSGTSQRARIQFASAAASGPYFFRAYFWFTTLPTAENRIVYVSNSATQDTGVLAYITIDNTGVLRLYDEDGQIGSTSSALSTGVHYRIELEVNRSPAAGSQLVAALLNGATFATDNTRNLSVGINHFYVGGNLHLEAQTTGAWSIDDVAINDSTGTSPQVSYPGSGKVICLRPSAAGDANTFAVQVGGTAGAVNNFTRVNETPPDDATSYNGSLVLAQEDLFNVDDSGIGVQDIVNCVAIGYRYADLVGADATAAFKVEVLKASGGTKAQSSTITPNSTTFRTYPGGGQPTATTPYMTYADPDGADWEKATLDTMQIGYALTTANVQTIAISNIYAMVDYTPYAGATSSPSNFMMFM